MSEEWPERWDVCTVEEAGEVALGRQRSPEHHNGPNMRPYLRVANVFEDRIDLSDVMEMNFTPDEVPRFALHPGDILLNEGQSRHLVGRPAMYRGELPGVCFTNSLVRFRARNGVDPSFALSLFLHYLRDGTFQDIASITTNIAHLGATKFAKLPFPRPPLTEQRRIVAKLDALRARSRRAKDALDAVPALLDRLRQSILAAAFRGDLTADWREQNPDVEPASELLKRIRIERRKRWEESALAKMRAKGKPPKDDRWKAKYVEPERVDETGLPELPDGWCWASVEDVASDAPRSIQSGPFGSNLLHSEFQKTGVLAIGIDNVRDGEFSLGSAHRISESKFRQLEQYVARPGDVLITVMATVGRCCVLPDDVERAIITKHVYRVSPERSLVLPSFLMQAMRGAPAVRAAMNDDVRGQTRPGINGGVIKSLPVPLAPLPEQMLVLAAVERGLRRAERVYGSAQAVTVALGTLDASILAAAFRGELLGESPPTVQTRDA